MASGAKVRAGVVGTGHMGQYHVLVYAELPDVELVGVVDADLARAAAVAAQYDTRVFPDHRALVGRVDVASVAVPTGRHFEVARDLLEAGISVLVEKPMTSTLDEARALFAVAERTGAVLHVGHVERFNGAVDELRQIVRAPILIESRRLGPFASRVQRDTVVMDLMIHDIDIVLGLVDSPPVRLAAQGAAVHSSVTDVASVRTFSSVARLAVIVAIVPDSKRIWTLATSVSDVCTAVPCAASRTGGESTSPSTMSMSWIIRSITTVSFCTRGAKGPRRRDSIRIGARTI